MIPLISLFRYFAKYHLGRLRGWFNYYGVRTWFPRDSFIFRLACRQGIYEYENLKLLLAMARPATMAFDVGANVGLLSIPLLREIPDFDVISFEPSSHAGPCLRRTRDGSGLASRWTVREEAVSDTTGTAQFFDSSSETNASDGLARTARLTGQIARLVSITTLVLVWQELGRPTVSLIKIDVEGAKLAVLGGASECLNRCRPGLLIEWNSVNLQAHRIAPEAILVWARSHRYSLHMAPDLAVIAQEAALHLAMAQTESFVFLLQS